MTIDVSNNNPRIEYSVSQGASQSVFTVPFEFFDNSDVKVYVDNVLKSEGANYSLAGGDGSTGTLTFSSPVVGATGGSIVSLVRRTSLERTTDFVAGQDINRAALNEQLDTIVAQIADLDDKVDRTIHLNDSEVAPSMLLTDDRKGRVMAFNSSTGAVEAGPLSNDIATIADNIAELLAVNDEAAAAAASATAAATSASAASTSATAAQTAQTAAELAETNAETAETNAETAETNAAASAASALASKTAASTSETNAAASEAASSTSETNAAASAAAASTSETNAATSETNAANSATASASSATASAASATAASASETAAASSETAAAASEAAASTSETNAAASETAAAASETAAASSASSASTSASSAASSASSAQASKDAALAALDSFDDRYLGQKTSDPTLDNDGDALVAGALYYNTNDEIMKVFDGSLWVAAYASLSGAMFGANNLSDVSSASDSRANLGLATVASSGDYTDLINAPAPFDPNALATVATTGSYSDLSGTPTLGTAAATASTDYATAAQGSLADSAVQINDSPTFAGITTTGDVSFGDNDKAIFGAGSDLQIYHDGVTSVIQETGSGDLRLKGTNIDFKSATNETYAYFQADGPSILYHNSSDKLATTSTGIDVTGTVTADGLTVDGQAIIGDLVAGSPNLTNLTSGTPPQLIAGWSVPAISWSPASSTEAVFTREGNMQVDILAGANQLANLNFSDPDSEDVGQISYDHSVDRMRFSINGSEAMRIESDGDLHADGNVIAYSTTISDIRLKKDIVKIEGALDKVCALNGYTFEYIADGKKSAGVIAQEVERVMPSAIVETALPLKTGTDEKFKTVQYDQLHGLLIEAIKELRAEIAELKGE